MCAHNENEILSSSVSRVEAKIKRVKEVTPDPGFSHQCVGSGPWQPSIFFNFFSSPNFDFINKYLSLYTQTSLIWTVWDQGVSVTKKCPLLRILNLFGDEPCIQLII